LDKQFVKDLRRGSFVESQFVVVDVRELPFSSPSKGGEYFLKLQLGDISGTIKGIIWDSALVKEPICRDDVLLIRGEVGEYNGPQLVISGYKKIEKENVYRSHFQATSSRDTEEMWEVLLNIARLNVQENNLQKLLEVFFADEKLVEKFKTSPAAKVIHHNYLGGLLEHTLEVVEICLQIDALYPQLNQSLLITAAIFHDLGKIEEYDPHSFVFEQTDKGRLLGHITIGLEIVRGLMERLPLFPEKLKMQLEHAMISHHGEKKWGSPEIPQTFEAFALFHADLLSARLKQFQQVMDKNVRRSSHWSGWDNFLGRRVYTGFTRK
jgi:3'-5' exoribonuclease